MFQAWCLVLDWDAEVWKGCIRLRCLGLCALVVVEGVGVIDNFVPYSNKHELSIIQGIQSSLNMMFLPLEEQGQQTNSSQISSPPENTQKQAILKSKQVLHQGSALKLSCSMVYLRCKASGTKATCTERDGTSGTMSHCFGIFQK